MRFCLEIKNNNDCYEVATMIQNQLEERGFTYDPKNPEIVISVGGDGTLLKAIHHYTVKDPLFISINEGNLGHLCQFNDDDIPELLDTIIARDFRYVNTFRLLKATVNQEDFYAFNELRFEANNGASLALNIDINNSKLEHYVGDGVCFSTAVGSTGMNKSLSGAVVDPELEIIQLSEKAPINSRVYKTLNSPIILGPDSIIELYNFSRTNFLFCFDNTAKNITLQDDVIHVELANKKVSILMNKDHIFIDKIRKSFIE